MNNHLNDVFTQNKITPQTISLVKLIKKYTISQVQSNNHNSLIKSFS